MSICGEGTYWDPTCANGCGACKPEGVLSCAESEGGEGKASDGGCGCRIRGGGGGAGSAALVALVTLAFGGLRRRRKQG